MWEKKIQGNRRQTTDAAFVPSLHAETEIQTHACTALRSTCTWLYVVRACRGILLISETTRRGNVFRGEIICIQIYIFIYFRKGKHYLYIPAVDACMHVAVKTYKTAGSPLKRKMSHTKKRFINLSTQYRGRSLKIYILFTYR